DKSYKPAGGIESVINDDFTLAIQIEINGAASRARLYVNGAVVIDHTFTAAGFDAGAGLFRLGWNTVAWNGLISDVRISDISRYDGDYITPIRGIEPFLETYISSKSPSGALDSFEEVWTYEETEDEIYTISHTASAKGNSIFDGHGGISLSGHVAAQEACHAAMKFSDLRNGTDSISTFFPLISVSGQHYNLVKSEQIDESQGRCTSSEKWVFQSGASSFIETYTIASRERYDDPNTEISINGNIVGLSESYNNHTDRYNAAYNVFPTIIGMARDRILEETNVDSLKTYPLSKMVSYDKKGGTISYELSYEAGPEPSISGAVEEEISIVDVGSQNIVASIDIPGRALGPIIQDMYTYSSPEREVSISCIMGSGWHTDNGVTSFRDKYLNKPDISGIVIACKPDYNCYVKSCQENWDPINLRYNYSISWIKKVRTDGSPFSYSYR
ncbi:MAG: hypothetical protein WC967_12225, partial [Balneolaceae bacterium]